MPYMISVHSFRRGTGKSTVAVNVAALLAAAGRRVGIVDMDMAAPSTHLYFGLQGDDISCTMSDYLLGACRIEEAARDVTWQLGKAAAGRLYVVPASDDANQIAHIMRRPYDVDRLSGGLEQLLTALALDILVIDTRAGLDEDSLLTFAISDCLAVILRPDRHDFQGTAVILDLARRLAVPRVALVVTQVPPAYSLQDVKTRAEETYHCADVAVLPYSPELAVTGGTGVFALSHAQHPLTRVFRQLATDLAFIRAPL